MIFKEINDRLTAEGITTEEFYRLFPKVYTDRGQHKAGNERLPWLGKVDVVVAKVDDDLTVHTYHLPDHDVYLQLYGHIRERNDEYDEGIPIFRQYPACVLTFTHSFVRVEPYQYTETRYKEIHE